MEIERNVIFSKTIKIKSLGRIVDANGFRKDQEKIEVIVKARVPSHVTEVKAYWYD